MDIETERTMSRRSAAGFGTDAAAAAGGSLAGTHQTLPRGADMFHLASVLS